MYNMHRVAIHPYLFEGGCGHPQDSSGNKRRSQSPGDGCLELPWTLLSCLGLARAVLSYPGLSSAALDWPELPGCQAGLGWPAQESP